MRLRTSSSRSSRRKAKAKAQASVSRWCTASCSRATAGSPSSSEPGAGTTIRVHLPQARARARRRQPRRPVRCPRPAPRRFCSWRTRPSVRQFAASVSAAVRLPDTRSRDRRRRASRDGDLPRHDSPPADRRRAAGMTGKDLAERLIARRARHEGALRQRLRGGRDRAPGPLEPGIWYLPKPYPPHLSLARRCGRYSTSRLGVRIRSADVAQFGPGCRAVCRVGEDPRLETRDWPRTARRCLRDASASGPSSGRRRPPRRRAAGRCRRGRPGPGGPAPPTRLAVREPPSPVRGSRMWSPLRRPEALKAIWLADRPARTRDGSAGSVSVNGQPSPGAGGSSMSTELNPPCTRTRSSPHSSSNSAMRSTA